MPLSTTKGVVRYNMGDDYDDEDDIEEEVVYEEAEDEHLLPPPSSWFGGATDDDTYGMSSCTAIKKSSHDDDHDDEDTPILSMAEDEVYEGNGQVHSAATRIIVPKLSSFPPPMIDAGTTVPSMTATTTLSSLAAPRKAPSWSEISRKVLPAAAKELLTTSLRRVLHTARLSYSNTAGWHRKYSDLGNNTGGYFRSATTTSTTTDGELLNLPPFSSLSWVDRQLVAEWRTITNSTKERIDGDYDNGLGGGGQEVSIDCIDHGDDVEHDDDEDDFDRARTLYPQPAAKPVWEKADICWHCRQPFGPTLLRHHCRLCGHSVCQTHSPFTHKLPHLGYDPNVPERVCGSCKRALSEQNLAERIAWRTARCRDYLNGDLTPYFDTGVDTLEDAALRITKAAIAAAKTIPLGAQATVAVETVDVLRKHGLKGIYGLILRKEFLAAADLLCKALGINKTSWPLSVHELSAAIFYALAQHRALRGMHPEREHQIHTLRKDQPQKNQTEEDEDDEWGPFMSAWTTTESDDIAGHVTRADQNSVIDKTDRFTYHCSDSASYLAAKSTSTEAQTTHDAETIAEDLPFSPVCDPVSDASLASLLYYAPMALNFVYATREVDMQLLAAQQGWRLVYAHIEQEAGSDRPASALFCHDANKIACLAIRGTATINDVVTDIRQMPVPFPESLENNSSSETSDADSGADDWMPIFRGKGLAVCGMARASVNLYREHMDALMLLVEKGYRVRIVGHSLGGGVATMLGTLVLRELERNKMLDRKRGTLRVYGYGTPSCVDARLSDHVKSFVTTVVLHDDVIPRLTPTSIRGLLKHLLHIRETWVKAHLTNDLLAITERAKTAWAPRWRQSFTLENRSLKRYCKQQLMFGKSKLLSVKGKLVEQSRRMLKVEEGDEENTIARTTKNEMDDGKLPQKSSFDLSVVFMDHNYMSNGEERAEEQWTDTAEGDADFNEEPKLMVDMMGGIDKRTQGIVIDGEEFFDTDEDLLEQGAGNNEHEGSFSLEILPAVDSLESHPSLNSDNTEKDDNNWACFDEEPSPRMSMSQSVSRVTSLGSAEEALEEEEEPMAAVMLEETPLPRMFLPGKIVHVYTHRGGYKAAVVPRAFRELRRISLAGNMLSDHTCRAYYEALLEVKNVRTAEEGLPRWVAFDEDVTCACCASNFTWASTSSTEAQEARDKHNCRSCGTLVCDPCSKKRIPLPSVGITLPVRVCDRCYNDIGGAWSERTSSFLEDEEAPNDHRQHDVQGSDEEGAKAHMMENRQQQAERQRDRRSFIVDELASRVLRSHEPQHVSVTI